MLPRVTLYHLLCFRFDILFSTVAKKSTIARQKNPKFAVRAVNRCFKCGRRRGHMRDFGLCRICFRELANEGKIPGITKS